MATKKTSSKAKKKTAKTLKKKIKATLKKVKRQKAQPKTKAAKKKATPKKATKKKATKKKISFLEDETHRGFLYDLIGADGMIVADKIVDKEVSDVDLAETIDMKPNIIRKYL